MKTIQTILHPTDFSEAANYAFRLACSLAQDHQAKMVVLHVTPPIIPMVGEMVALPPEPFEESREELHKKLHELKPTQPELEVEYVLEEGDPVSGILETAEDKEAGLIVMGTHGRTGLKRLLMGSVAELVVRKAACPVLTVKTPAPEQAHAEPAREKAGAS